jgi:putative flippase GtrA
MTLTTTPPVATEAPATSPVLDVVVPVHNEVADLEPGIRRVHEYLTRTLPYSFRITIADNASTDGTLGVARRLADELPHLVVVHLAEKGRGRALRTTWSASDAAVLAYMDVDLSTDLAALLPLVAPLVSGHSDLAIGTRLSRSARVVRGPKRELLSRGYNLLLRTTLSIRFSDAQCGFKAIRADRARQLLPFVEDTGWFFDTELLVLAERAGLRIHEVPVDWVDDPDSRVDIVATAMADLRGIVRLSRALGSGRLPVAALRDQADAEARVPTPPGLVGQLIRFAIVGLASTVAYSLLFLVLRGVTTALWANTVALLLTAMANTAVNRRMTFGVRGRHGRLRHQAQGLVVFGLALAVTTGSLLTLHDLAPGVGRGVEVAVLCAANVAATLLRFLLFRAWLFPSRRTSTPIDATTARTT